MTKDLGSFRTIQVKIIIFFTMSFLVLGTVLTFTAISNNNRVKSLYNSRTHDEKLVLEHDLESLTQLTEALAPDYSQWDDPYLYLLGKKPDYAVNNMTIDTLSTFESDGMWIFNKSDDLVYGVTNPDILKNTVDLKLYTENIRELFRRNYLIHFYISTNSGILSVYGSTVVPSSDIRHEKKSPGYVLTGKLLNNDLLKTLQSSNRNLVTYVPPGSPEQYPASFAPKTGKLAYEIAYTDIKGSPIGRIYGNSISTSIAALHNSGDQLLVMNMLSFLTLLIMLLICIWRWVIKPTSDIYEALDDVDQKLLKKMALKKSEFGKIAELIDRFFDQEKSLENEIVEKKKLLEKLAAYNTEIELTNNIMIGRELKMIEMKKKLAEYELQIEKLK